MSPTRIIAIVLILNEIRAIVSVVTIGPSAVTSAFKGDMATLSHSLIELGVLVVIGLVVALICKRYKKR